MNSESPSSFSPIGSPFSPEQKLGKLVIDPGAAKDFERPFKTRLKTEEQLDQGPYNRQMGSNSSESEGARDSFVNKHSSEEMDKP